ncbi:hypothetical protein ACFPRL_32270 [Pseudoclavibacter helvolus]
MVRRAARAGSIARSEAVGDAHEAHVDGPLDTWSYAAACGTGGDVLHDRYVPGSDELFRHRARNRVGDAIRFLGAHDRHRRLTVVHGPRHRCGTNRRGSDQSERRGDDRHGEKPGAAALFRAAGTAAREIEVGDGLSGG